MHISWTFLKWVSCDFCCCMWSSTKGAKVIALICPFKLNIDLFKAFVEEPFSTFSYMDILCPFKCEREEMWSLLWRCWKQRRGSSLWIYLSFAQKKKHVGWRVDGSGPFHKQSEHQARYVLCEHGTRDCWQG